MRLITVLPHNSFIDNGAEHISFSPDTKNDAALHCLSEVDDHPRTRLQSADGDYDEQDRTDSNGFGPVIRMRSRTRSTMASMPTSLSSRRMPSSLKRYLARSPWSWAWEWRFGSEETEESFAGFAGGNDVGYARTHWVAMVGGGRVWCCLLLDEVAEESVGSWDAASCFPS